MQYMMIFLSIAYVNLSCVLFYKLGHRITVPISRKSKLNHSIITIPNFTEKKMIDR